MIEFNSAVVTPEQVGELVAKSAESGKKFWEIQGQCNQELVQRSGSKLMELADARMQSVKDIFECQTFSQAFEIHMAYEESAIETWQELYKDNANTLSDAQEQVAALFAVE